MAEMKMPRVMIAAPGSGSGKTMITCGLLELLRRAGRPISFKCGPDYIDPMFHRFVLNIPSRNLDTFFTAPDRTRSLMGKACMKEGADLAVIEGVMGYYDGLGGVSVRGSSYELSVQTGTPVILVVNGRGMSLSIAALIRGFMDMYPDQMIRGVILNRVSKGVCERLTPIIEEKLGIAVIGYVPETEVICFPSRHLGLMMPEEIVSLREQIQKFASLLEETLDIRKLKTIAEAAEPLNWKEDPMHVQRLEDAGSGKLRIGVAMDAAFCFYYEDNLRMLHEAGADLVAFSPLHDKQLPENVQGILLGGGYPELCAEALSGNVSMRKSIREAIVQGMPSVAECGGFMYLHETLTDEKGQTYPMVGAIRGGCHNTGKLVRFGYVNVIEQESHFLSQKVIRAHEFHYYDSDNNGESCEAVKPTTGRKWKCIHENENFWWGYPHLYYPSNPAFVEHFIGEAKKWKKREDRCKS